MTDKCKCRVCELSNKLVSEGFSEAFIDHYMNQHLLLEGKVKCAIDDLEMAEKNYDDYFEEASIVKSYVKFKRRIETWKSEKVT